MEQPLEALLSFCEEPDPDPKHEFPYDEQRLNDLGAEVYESTDDQVIRAILLAASYDDITTGFSCHDDKSVVDLDELAYKLKNKTSIPRHVGIDFCSECNSMLHPAETSDRTRLVYKCRSCNNEVEKPNAFCIYVNNVTEDVGSLTRMNPDIVSDPTLPHSSTRPCPQCGHEDAVYFQAQVNREKSNMQLFYVCCNCKHQWRDHVIREEDEDALQ